jgi:3'-phosphoadenosine 5'-phosphosulfate sulfotransferase (PAPS reductase)/FAD synthetase
MEGKMEDKIRAAIRRIEAAKELFGNGLFLGHSGGKDSCVIYRLTKAIVPNIKVLHTLKFKPDGAPDMHPATWHFVKALAAEETITFVSKDETQEVLDQLRLRCQIDGTRIDEADRTEKSNHLIVNGKEINRRNMPCFVGSGIFNLSILYPIYDWTDHEVWKYIHEWKVPVSDEYIETGEINCGTY